MTLINRGLILALVIPFAFAETLYGKADTLISSRTLLLEGVRLNDDGKYKEAIALFRKVPQGDTNYAIAVNELAISSLNDSAFSEARKYCLEGLELPGRPSRRSFLLMLGHAEDYLGNHKEALRYYDSLIAMNPYDHQPWYEKGALYMLQKDLENAIACFRHSMLLNPLHFRTHLNLGNALLQQGRLSEAYLALSFSLFMSNEKALAARSMILINSIQNQNDEVAGYYKARNKEAMDPSYEETDEIIHSKLALSKDYKFQSALAGDGTANTFHALLEKLKYDANDTSLVMQYYVPFFTEAYANGQFDDMMLLMYSSYGIEGIDQMVKKRKSAVQDFYQVLQDYTGKIAATQVLNYRQRKSAPERYKLLGSENIFVVGGIRSLDPLKFAAGRVVLYKGGDFLADGNANAAGEKDGDWVFYYQNGFVKSREQFRNGKLTGSSQYYRDNGTLEKEYKYNAAGNAIEERQYTYNGVLESATIDHESYADFTSYLYDGTVEYKAKLVKGKIQDPVLKIMQGGNIPSKELHFENGKREGVSKFYYSNGKLSDETEYHAGERSGKGVSYYKNGQIHYVMAYSDDKLDGPYQEFDENGKLIERGEYRKGRKTGIMESLTPEGRVYGTITYRKDLPVAYRYTDEEGKVLSNGDKSSDDGLPIINAYYPTGIKMSEVPLNSGKTQGTVKYYYPSGTISKQSTYEDDHKEGKETEYYHNGLVKNEAYFTNDNLLGPLNNYTDAGTKRSQGFLDGSRCGLWQFYYPNGKLETESFYVSGKLNGPEKNYFANGNLSYTRIFDMDMLVGLIEYDTNGRRQSFSLFPQGNGTYETHHPNGRLALIIQLVKGYQEGAYNRYYPNGELFEKGTMKGGVQEGDVVFYHPNGQPLLKGRLHKGSREGNWVWYAPTGQAEWEMNYVEGEEDGAEKRYVAGTLHTSYSHRNGNLDGREIFYGDSNKVAGILIYKDDIITGYTYLGKDGKEMPLIPLKAGSGHVITYYQNGQQAVDFTFANSVITGDATRWHSNGQKAYDLRHADHGNREGKCQRWSPNGKLIYETTYHNDLMVGPERSWNTDGQLVSYSEYSEAGERHGLHTAIDPATGKKGSARYYYGSVVQSLP